MFQEQNLESLLDKLHQLQAGLLSEATGGSFEGGDDAYRALRQEVMARADLRSHLPDFIRRYRDLGQFWQFIKFKFSTYAERRTYLWDSFSPALEYLEASERAPGLQMIGAVLEEYNPETVHAAWQKALDRRAIDPEGAITAARSLLESVCKHILDDAGVEYSPKSDLPRLWGQCAEELNLAPQQHEEQLFKTILGNCQSVVSSLGALRNKIGDAHGSGRRAVKPKPRHAELAVNLAGTMASFLVSTWKDRSS
ncbi:abortive infection family protein [Maricaulis sp.]|uniref:abortive infection family protein n=1 Tax=Maricaulis sp. TaxID=1486257 RepID=UPI000C691935|nr:abortive infection family protein [Maricaulis sp.]MAC88119.1 abortive phage resistance protein [Maricaulis sp.]